MSELESPIQLWEESDSYFIDHLSADSLCLVLTKAFWDRVPTEFNFVAMDEDGELYAFSDKPIAEQDTDIVPLNGSKAMPCSGFGVWGEAENLDDAHASYLADLSHLAINWKTSLRERGEYKCQHYDLSC